MSVQSAYLMWADPSKQTRRLYFDAVMTEQHEFTAEITEHAVEKGANITDHVRKNLDRLVLEVLVTNTPIVPTDPNNIRGGRMTALDIFVPVPDQSLLSLNTLQNKAVAAIGGLLGLNKSPPKSAVVWNYPNQFDAIAEALATLQQLQDEATLLEVITPKLDYANMVITDIGMTRDKSSFSTQRFTITLRRLNIVEVQLVSAPVPTENRGVGPKPKGVKEGEPPEEGKQKSVAAWALSKLGVLNNGRLSLPGGL